MPTSILTASRYPASSASPNVPQDIQNAVNDLEDNVSPRFASTSARDTAYTNWVSAGNTMVAGLECFTTDKNLKWIYTGTAWSLAGWFGDDKTTQPMISLTSATTNVVSDGSGTLLINWPTVVDHGGGLLTYTASTGRITCNVPGKIRIDAVAESNPTVAGWSKIWTNHPGGGGLAQSTIEDQRPRTVLNSAAPLEQNIGTGPIKVNAGDFVAMNVLQSNTSASLVTYGFWFAVTYV